MSALGNNHSIAAMVIEVMAWPLNARKKHFSEPVLRSEKGDLKEILHTDPKKGKMMLEKTCSWFWFEKAEKQLTPTPKKSGC